MVISHGKRFIFIHNYKVAGSSIRNAVDKYGTLSVQRSPIFDKVLIRLKIYPGIYGVDFPHHCTASYIKDKIPPDVFRGYYKFGFVRDPWDWQVSLYKYMLKEKSHPQHELVESFADFKEYLVWRLTNEVRLQKDFFYDAENNLLVDFVGKYENLQDDFNLVCKHLKLNSHLPHLNKSRQSGDYLKYYTQDLIDWVQREYKEDIAIFGYQKPILG